MKKKYRLITIAALFLAAIALFLVSGIGSTRAALSEFSEDYTSRVSMNDIGLTLLENGNPIAHRNYSKAADGSWDISGGSLLADVPDKIIFEKEYPEVLALQNTGTIDQYVRVSIYRYWMIGEGEDAKKVTTLSPELIQLKLNDSGAWMHDSASDTTERTVLYYSSLLPAGAVTEPFMESIAISNELATKVTQTTSEDGKTITTTYDYDGVRFCLEVTADAVQDHNAEDAKLSAWGVVR